LPLAALWAPFGVFCSGPTPVRVYF
jgi:hypothetical protein